MSGIAGTFERDGAPAALDRVQRMADAAAYRGPDGVHYLVDRSIALAHQRLDLLHSNGIEVQPLHFPPAGLVISMDGRLDNRAELARALGVANPDGVSDASLVLRAYERWRDGTPARLLGDFAFVIWDTRRREVFCARDVMGVKPFYYHVSDRRFVWGSDITQVLAAGVPHEPNEGMVAEYLARSVQSHHETLFQGVLRLPAAHAMTVDAESVKVRRYWQLDPSAELACASTQEYADRFRALFEEAVACRLRSDMPVAVQLSGGIDSSAVAAVATAQGAQLEAFSLVVAGDSFADESAYIDAVTSQARIPGHKIGPSPFELAGWRSRALRQADVLDLPSDLAGEGVLSAMQARGRRVVLTGVGGDYGFSGTLYHYADLLGAFDVPGFIKQVWADARVSDVGWTPSQVFWSGIRPVLPRSLREAARPLARRLGWTAGDPSWIAPSLARRVHLSERLAPPRAVPQTGAYSRRYICEQFASGWPYRLLEASNRLTAQYGLEERHPFFDRRIVEFAVAIPEAQRWQGRHTKFVVRNGTRDVLPAAVASRTDKGDYSVCLVRAFEALGSDFFDDLKIASAGWVDAAQVRSLRERALGDLARGDEAFCQPMLILWMIAGVELWFDETFERGVRHGRTIQPGHTAAPREGRDAETVQTARAH